MIDLTSNIADSLIENIQYILFVLLTTGKDQVISNIKVATDYLQFKSKLSLPQTYTLNKVIKE